MEFNGIFLDQKFHGIPWNVAFPRNMFYGIQGNIFSAAYISISIS